MSETKIRIKKRQQVEKEDNERLLHYHNQIINDNNLKKFQQNADLTDFNNACEQFKNVCEQIKEFAQFQEFKGGFEEAMEFLNSQAFKQNQIQGILLFSLWQGADKLCTYQAKKIGIAQPNWWKKCWNIEE